MDTFRRAGRDDLVVNIVGRAVFELAMTKSNNIYNHVRPFIQIGNEPLLNARHCSESWAFSKQDQEGLRLHGAYILVGGDCPQANGKMSGSD